MKKRKTSTGPGELAAAKPALQARSMASRDAVINALERLLETHSIDQIRIAQVAEAAGVSVGTIYRRFDSKDALKDALLELYELRLTAWASEPENLVELDDDATLQQTLEVMAAQAWRQINAMPSLMRAAMTVAQTDMATFNSRLEPLLTTSYQGFEVALNRHSEEVGGNLSDNALRMVFYFFQTILLDHGLYAGGLGRYSPSDDIDFPKEVARFAYGYLMLEKER